MQFDKLRRREFIAPLGGALFLFLCISAAAQEGYYGEGHDKWHQDFYSKLKRNDGRGPCCSLMDCRPTQSRMVGDHYEVKVDGEWIQVPNDKINKRGRARWWRSRLRPETDRQQQGRSILRHPSVGGLRSHLAAATMESTREERTAHRLVAWARRLVDSPIHALRISHQRPGMGRSTLVTRNGNPRLWALTHSAVVKWLG
jgi:hypothetical protein